jgi:hypothetical protein
MGTPVNGISACSRVESYTTAVLDTEPPAAISLPDWPPRCIRPEFTPGRRTVVLPKDNAESGGNRAGTPPPADFRSPVLIIHEQSRGLVANTTFSQHTRRGLSAIFVEIPKNDRHHRPHVT